jgi:hypothetical protein
MCPILHHSGIYFRGPLHPSSSLDHLSKIGSGLVFNSIMAPKTAKKPAKKVVKKTTKPKITKKTARKTKKATKKKARKVKRVSKIAKGKRAKLVVFKGTKEKTTSGLKKADLTKNKSGKIVSKKAHANGLKSYKRISGWTAAVAKARKALNIKGFCAVNGKTAQGKALYAKAKSFYK